MTGVLDVDATAEDEDVVVVVADVDVARAELVGTRDDESTGETLLETEWMMIVAEAARVEVARCMLDATVADAEDTASDVKTMAFVDPGGVKVETIVFPGPFLVVRVVVAVVAGGVDEVAISNVVVDETTSAETENRDQAKRRGEMRIEVTHSQLPREPALAPGPPRQTDIRCGPCCPWVQSTQC